jgi:hypothetical protein
MSNVTEMKGKRFRDSLKGAQVKLVGFSVAGMGLVASASAAIDLNGTIGPILDSMIALIPSIISLIVALVPAIIVMAVVGFLVSFFDRILKMLKI